MQETTPPILIEDLGILFPNETSKRASRYGMYQCNCGNTFKTRTSYVNTGHTLSCGCNRKAILLGINTTHGYTKHPIRRTWSSMIQRTTNPNDKGYKDYGAKGITVCERWLDTANFIEDMLPTWRKGLSIDRIDPLGNYEPFNCRWSTRTIQARNTRVLQVNNTSGYRGVFYDKRTSKWVAQIKIDNKAKYLGSFTDKLNAAIAYDKYVLDNSLEHTVNGAL